LVAVPSSAVVDSHLAHIVAGIVDTAHTVGSAGTVVGHIAVDFAGTVDSVAGHIVAVEYTVIDHIALVTDTAADYIAMADIALIASASDGQQLPQVDFRNQHRNARQVHSACHNCCKMLALKLLVEQQWGANCCRSSRKTHYRQAPLHDRRSRLLSEPAARSHFQVARGFRIVDKISYQ